MVEALRAALPANAVITAATERAVYEEDWRHIHAHQALCVVLPASTAEVASVVKLCAAAGAAIVPQGGNTSLVAGAVPVEGPPQIVLSLKRCSKIFELDPVGNTVTAQAGAIVAAVQAAAAAAGRLFPVSFGGDGTAQIGGAISTNAGGIQVLAYGSMRAHVLGLEVVLPDGRIWNGLRALRKDNTGFDLKQLFIGAEGTLGIITAACLRLFPEVTSRATALVGVASLAQALLVFQALRAAGPALTMCEFMTQAASRLGAAHLPDQHLPFDAAAYLLVELSAHGAGDVQSQLETILAAALESGAAGNAVIAQSERERAALVRLREAISDAELAEGGAVKHDIAVPIAAIPNTVAAVEALIDEKFPDCRPNIFGHIGDGNLHVNIRPPPGQTLADLGARGTAITSAIEALAVTYGGSFSAEHGIGQMRLTGMAAHKSAVELALMRQLKTAFDPSGLLNPGKMLPR